MLWNWFEKYADLNMSKISSYFTEWIFEQYGIITQLLPLVIARGTCVKEPFSVNKLDTGVKESFSVNKLDTDFILEM